MLKKNIIIPFMIGILLISFDQYCKFLVVKHINILESIDITSFFRIILIWNKGISFGLLSNIAYIEHLLFPIITLLLLLITYFYIKMENPTILDHSIYILVISGGISNVIDRINYNAVCDYIDIYYQTHHFFIFNIADLYISIGGILILIQRLLQFTQRSID